MPDVGALVSRFVLQCLTMLPISTCQAVANTVSTIYYTWHVFMLLFHLAQSSLFTLGLSSTTEFRGRFQEVKGPVTRAVSHGD